MQELVWMVVNQCDFEKSKSQQLSIRSPFLEWVICLFYWLMNKLFGNFVRVFLILYGVNFGKRMSYLLPIKIFDKFQKEAIVRQVSIVKYTMRI